MTNEVLSNDVLSYIEEQTKESKEITIKKLVDHFRLSRNVMTRMVNEFLKNDALICVNDTEKVLFHRETLEKHYQLPFENSSFANRIAFEDYINHTNNKDFMKLIGSQGSLLEAVDMCKAAISYPNKSLPLLLNGSTGTGKSFMAQLIFEYAVNQEIIDAQAPFVTLNCSEFANNPELLTANLFGHKKGSFTGADEDNKGLLAVADGGILFLDEVHCLQSESQEKLFLFMDQGIYHQMGENEVWEKADVRFIFATTENPEKALLKTFLRRVPIVVSIPDLSQRSMYEKAQLIYTIFKKEENNIKAQINLTTFVYNTLLNHTFSGNVGALKNTIKVCIARAVSSSTNGEVAITMNHLPNTLFDESTLHNTAIYENECNLFQIDQLVEGFTDKRNIIGFYDSILASYRTLQGSDDFSRIIKKYFNHLLFDKQKTMNNKTLFINNKVNESIMYVFSRHGLKIPNNDLLVLNRFIEMTQKNIVAIERWYEENRQAIDDINVEAANHIPYDMRIAYEVNESLKSVIDITLDKLFLVLFAHIIYGLHSSQNRLRLGVIIAHGFSTASSIANTVNDLIGEHIFESLDMPINVSTEEIVFELNDFLETRRGYEEIIFLVDMGSLEKIHMGLAQSINARIGIVNNITTKVALEIGYGLKQSIQLEDLLSKVTNNNTFNYRIVEKREKEHVIVCSCASGVGTAEKIKKLLDDSLPTTLDVKVVTYDFNTLSSQKEQNELFDIYDIICIIGTLDPLIQDVRFIAIEDLIIDNDINFVYDALSSHMNIEEIDRFKAKILRNFSLNNLMEYLTILNPNKLLEHIATALDEFQKSYGIQMSNNMSVGLYVHICCMVERVVMHADIDHYDGIERIVENFPDFFIHMKQAFEPVEDFYGIEVPINEYGYIYEYIESLITH